MDDDTWRDRYLATRSITNPGERAALYREAARGRFVPVVRGVYLDAEEWTRLDVPGRHVARMRAHAVLRPHTVFSHLSAALVWGLPVVATRLVVPHSVAEAAAGGRSRNELIRHTIGVPDDLRRIDGLLVTSPQDTVVHVATTARPETSVPVLDAALANVEWRLDREVLTAAAERMPSSAGPIRGRWSLGFADPRSGSAGESLSRVTIWRGGLPAPDLQCRFHDGRGLIGIVDFFWPEFGLVGEFDGLGKYVREDLRDGRDAATVVVDEKRRENRLRALDFRVARWEWADALSSARLGSILGSAGLRASRLQMRVNERVHVQQSGA